ncbi:hypothetical protein RhiirA5_403342 [Rhizophagus irregularis]|uniref:RRM domain-containing protein n=1 Tax=Rhizophagus irregularis TaxID=588596 RepID=A0A2N0P036_9GLOM|nr:hypothetical protein RhiirA5_403342 [Rhizophagus irregularis]
MPVKPTNWNLNNKVLPDETEERDQDATVYINNLDERCTEALIWELMLLAGPVTLGKKNLDVSASLFIRNLDSGIGEKMLYDTFSAFGITSKDGKGERHRSAADRCSTFGVNVPFVGKSGKPHTTSQKNPLKTINVTPPPDNDSYTIASDSSYITVIEPTSIGFPSASSRQFLQDCHRSNRDNQLPADSSTQAPSAQDVERITISERLTSCPLLY